MKIIKKRFIIRACMVFVWLSALFFFFFSPVLFRYFRTERAINLLIWPSMIDVKIIKKFQESTGIKVNVTYYESNEELLRKFQITKGQGYDLVIAADYSIAQLINENLLQKIEKQKLPFFKQLRSNFVHHYFDEANDYSIPYYLGIYGLGINSAYFKNDLPKPSWSLLFEQHNFRVTMSDDPRRATALAQFYLFKNQKKLTAEQIQAITALLHKQKNWVELYSDVRGEELLAAQSCPVVLTISPDLWRIQQEFPQLKFVVPQEGSFMVLDSFIIPATSQKKALAYQLLNFLYEPSILKQNATQFGFCPPLTTIDVKQFGILCPDEQLMQQLQFFNQELSKDVINAIWIAVMA